MTSILITGANGFVGSHLVDYALAADYKVFAGVRRNSNLQYLDNKAVTIVDLAYHDSTLLKEQLQRIANLDIIIHCAGLTNATNPDDYDLVNTQYSINVIDALIESNSTKFRFIYLSSLAAVGPKVFSMTEPIIESDIPTPNTRYGLSKLNAESYLASQNIDYSIIRPTSIYGERDQALKLLYQQINFGFLIRIIGVDPIVSFIHINDLVKAVFLIIESKKSSKEDYNVSDGDNYLTSEVYRLLKISLGKKFVLTIPLFGSIVKLTSEILALFQIDSFLDRDRASMLLSKNWSVNNSKLRALGFSPEFNLKKGLAQVRKYYTEN